MQPKQPTPRSLVTSVFSSVQSLSCVRLFVIPWTAAHQASLSITNSRSLLKLMSIESVMPSNHLLLCLPLLLLSSIFPSIRVFSSESALRIRWPKFWSFSFSISPSNKYSGLICFRMDWLDLFDVQRLILPLLLLLSYLMALLCSLRLWDPCSLSLDSPTSLATSTELPWMVCNPTPSARLRPLLSLTFPCCCCCYC